MQQASEEEQEGDVVLVVMLVLWCPSKTGYTRPLVHEDLFELHPKETADIICAR